VTFTLILIVWTVHSLIFDMASQRPGRV
jgi:hypothetical protein